ncbi:MAG: hypothetical protein QOE86_3844 [Solirubrobacteraceae bacterium]|jgi:hypothetical protein|nr:hypothetical protein [Solirubrobacteraceae bacterium]
MLARRLLVFVAILMGLTALAAGLAAPRGPGRAGTAQGPLLGTPVRPASPLVERTVDLAEPRTVDVAQGEELRLTVHGDELDAVELVGLDQLQPIAPETPAVFDVLADTPGSYPIRLLESGRQAGRLRVNPAAG